MGSVPHIINRGSNVTSIGTETQGDKSLQLGGQVKNTGLVEVPMGVTLREVVLILVAGFLVINGLKLFRPAVLPADASGGTSRSAGDFDCLWNWDQ